MNELAEKELSRYSRQLLLWDKEKQEKLKGSTVFIAGAGGLGSPVSIYLAVAGVGKIKICDFDVVDLTNLNRQILHSESKVGVKKVVSAKETLQQINNNIEIIPISEKIEKENVSMLVGNSDIIVDCMDNYPTRFILNEHCVRKRIPFVHGAIYGLEGQLTFIHHPDTLCLSCLFNEAPPKEVFPVVGVTPGVIGCLQAVEVLKYLTGVGENLKNKLLIWDGLTQDFRKIIIKKDPKCPVCSKL